MTSACTALKPEIITLPWQEPLAVAAPFASGDICLLYSGMRANSTGRYSYLAIQPVDTLQGESLKLLDEIHGDEKWFGTLAYELKNDIEALHKETQQFIPQPMLHFTRYAYLYVFDHEARCIYATADAPALTAGPIDAKRIQVSKLNSNMNKKSYLQAVTDTIEQIQKGAFYQANITRKFYGEWDCKNPFAVFAALCEASPSPYSCFMRRGEQCVLSSSPELFLEKDSSSKLISRPIKGTISREETADTLAQSSKDKAENLMIVDLMRNDFSRVCENGSVHTSTMFDVETYKTVHHMASTVMGQCKTGCSISDVLRATFPPGSMTGAPKIAAMQWCSAQERIQRGIYSGAIGWISGQGEMELSVVIRTLICDTKRFEFQVGGGIVADSHPESEWEETLTKAKGLCNALGISTDSLANL